MFTVEFKNKTTELRRVVSYCFGCRGVLEPVGITARVLEEDHADEAAHVRRLTTLRSAYGKPVSGKLIVPWSEFEESVDAPIVRTRQLYEDWSATTVPTDEIRNRLRRYLRRENPPDVHRIPTAIGDVAVDERLVAHIFVPGATRRDADHLKFWPLTLPNLTEPFEIDEVPAEEKTETQPAKPRRYYFLTLFEIASKRETHLVVVHADLMYVITSLRLENPAQRLDTKRRGSTLRFSQLIDSPGRNKKAAG